MIMFDEYEQVADLSYSIHNTDTLRSSKANKLDKYESIEEGYKTLLAHIDWMEKHGWRKA